jgi:hypothetical protein
MRKALALVILLVLASHVPAQANAAGTFRAGARKGAQRATVIMKTRAFDASKHKVQMVKEGDLHVMKIDGRTAYGTDGGTPDVEIESLRLLLNGREVPVPRRLYADCFNPGHGDDRLVVKFGDDAQSVFVFMNGSDGAGVYDVVWVLRRDGRHSRFATAGGDCHLFNLDCGLSQE